MAFSGGRSAGTAGGGGGFPAVPARPGAGAEARVGVAALYTLSDDQTEYQLRDRLSFMRFVRLALHEPVPDAKTIWLYREQLGNWCGPAP